MRKRRAVEGKMRPVVIHAGAAMEALDKLNRLSESHDHRIWPAPYGVVGDYLPNGLGQQLKFPLVWKP